MGKTFLLLTILIIFSCQKTHINKSVLLLNSVDAVRLYSYPSRTMWDTVNYGKEIITFKNGKLSFDKTKVIDSLVLSNSLKDKILNILTDTKWVGEGMQAACYEPRHLFSFYKDNKIIGYYEVCLECGGWESSEELNDLPMFCIEKGDELKELFIKMNLKNIGEEFEN